MMTLQSPLLFDERMRSTVVHRRVLVAVRPRLLAETLARALATADVDIVLDAPTGDLDDHFDVAVVLGSLPADTTADVIVCLPTSPDAIEGSVTTASGTQPAPVGDLPGLLETLHRLLSSF